MADTIAYVEHPSDVIANAISMIQQNRRFTLITSVGIEGGAAREVGSLALVDDTGHMVGYLSNGCIDKDIQFHATEAAQTGTKRVVRYGDGSQFADLTLPCGGALDVLIDPNPDSKTLLRAHGDLMARQTATLTFQLDGNGGHKVSFTYAPKFRLVLAGRGAILRATAEVGKSADFQVYLISPDEDDIAAVADLCAAAPVHLTSPDQDVSMDWLDGYSAFLTLFHDHEWEPELLRQALASPAIFVGALGSRRTHEGRLAHLQALGVDAQDRQRVKGPIGLIPSLREAPLIAISAVAEIASNLPAAIRANGVSSDV